MDDLERNLQVSENADEILRVTEAEIELNLARRLETREEVDAYFGGGWWRPLPRHLVFQDGVPRAIDDAKAGKQNKLTDVCETIVCASAEWPAVTARAVLLYIQRLRNRKQCPRWLVPRTGSDDMWKGFRQNHPRKEDEGFCVITFIHPRTGTRVYSRLRGLPFGMGYVVNQFNRLPHLKSAVLRRLLAMLACH